MSQSPPAAFAPPPNPPGRPRPRGRWYAIAALLLVLGGVVAVTSVVLSIKAFTAVDADVPADGSATTVAVDAGTDYLVWRHPADAVQCTVTNADGSAARTAGLGATRYTRGSWEGLSTFDPTGDEVQITCADGTGPIQVGEKPHVESLVGGGVLLGIVLPIVVAVAGFVWLFVLAILFATGAKRVATD